tara:strand:- start:463 stop:1383 length:921 start_codon:yes stop_codon:yes gene_type:complete
MADLPRFRRGRVGGIDFSQLNELLGRVDGMKETSETSAIDREQDAQSKPIRTMLVYATPSGSVEGGVQKFDWEEVMVRGDYEDAVLPSDKIVDQADSDYEPLKQFGNQQLRSGSAAAGTHAISTDDGFAGGYTFCMVISRTDGRKRYVIVPGGSAPRQQFVLVTEPSADGIVFGDDGMENNPDSINIPAVMHKGRLFEVQNVYDETNEFSYLRPVFIGEEDELIDILDFSLYTNGLYQVPQFKEGETNIDAEISLRVGGFKTGGISSVVLAGYVKTFTAILADGTEFPTQAFVAYPSPPQFTVNCQ